MDALSPVWRLPPHLEERFPGAGLREDFEQHGRRRHDVPLAPVAYLGHGMMVESAGQVGVCVQLDVHRPARDGDDPEVVAPRAVEPEPLGLTVHQYPPTAGPVGRGDLAIRNALCGDRGPIWKGIGEIYRERQVVTE